MVSNILNAILSIKNNNDFNLLNIYVIPKSNPSAINRANNVGEALEFFMKDAFCDSFQVTDNQSKKKAYSDNFSYLGNQNNPPDIILKESDAIEVKKIDGVRPSDLALNSSYPKSKLHSDSPMITSACKECEDWEEKDIIYAVGLVSNDRLKALALVYGDCFAASKEIYERIRKTVVEGLNQLDVELAETKELGRVNRVDPLGITNLRIRGMWTIQNPLKLFSELFGFSTAQDNFALYALMREEKYNQFQSDSRKNLESEEGISVDNVEIQEPDNPAKMIGAKMIRYVVK